MTEKLESQETGEKSHGGATGQKEEVPKRRFYADVSDSDMKKLLDPKRVLKILEYRRKLLDFTESMLESEISLHKLKAGEEFLSRNDYDSITQERYLLKICGFPLCPRELTREWKQKFHVSLKDKRIYDVEIRKLYCSVRCMDASIKYRDDNLPEEPIWMRLDDVKITPNFEIRMPSP